MQDERGEEKVIEMQETGSNWQQELEKMREEQARLSELCATQGKLIEQLQATMQPQTH